MSERNEKREAMMAKVRKLLAMANDGRGNEQERDTAMRQANKLMAEFGISEAEADLACLQKGEMQFGEAACGWDGKAPEPGVVYRSFPAWAGILAVGVARFTDAIVVRTRNMHGDMLGFRGERGDVLFARWLHGCLALSIMEAQKASGWTSRRDADPFRKSAASTLARRLKELADERLKMYREAQQTSNSRALVVVSEKALQVAKKFGEQRTKRGRGSRVCGASIAGAEAGQRINIPAGRPVGASGGPSALLN